MNYISKARKPTAKAMLIVTFMESLLRAGEQLSSAESGIESSTVHFL
jgi:hypothetical protein